MHGREMLICGLFGARRASRGVVRKGGRWVLQGDDGVGDLLVVAVVLALVVGFW